MRRAYGRRFGAVTVAAIAIIVSPVQLDAGAFVFESNGQAQTTGITPTTKPSFLTPLDYPTGIKPEGLATGDFNGDGVLDLAIANSGDGTVSVLLGNHDSFDTEVAYSVGGTPSAVVVADFDGDGKQDIAVAIGSGVSVLLGKGDGTFGTSLATAVSGGVYSLAAGDFNNDEKTDLVSANPGNEEGVSVLIGKGDGTFQVTYVGSGGYYPYAVAVGDINGDGNQDVVIANEDSGDRTNAVSTLIGHGDGTFAFGAEIMTGANGGFDSILAVDLNGDGKADIAVTAGGSINIIISNGDGTFQPPHYFPVGDEAFSVASGDFNGDGKVDLVVANLGDSGLSILLGNGDGSFQAPVNYLAGAGPYSVITGDFNGDGKLDLALADSQGNSAGVIAGGGDGRFQSGSYFIVPATPSAIATTDFNQDGNLDLVIAQEFDQEGTVEILLGNGNGSFQPLITYSDGRGPCSIATGDFNGDGYPDFATADCGSTTVDVFVGNGDGTFSSPVTYNAGQTLNAVVIGDLNNDGIQDLALTAPGIGVYALLGNGNGTFQSPIATPFASTSGYATLADFNRDGKLDMAVTNSNGDITVLLGDGEGNFQIGGSFSVGTNPTSIRAADFNKDGFVDLALCAGGHIVVLEGKGDGTFETSATYLADVGPDWLTVRDFNGDGKLDLAATNSISGDLSVLLGNGDGTFQAPVDYGLGTTPVALTEGDFDGDGKPDIAILKQCNWLYCENGTLAILPNIGHPFFLSATVSPASLNFGDQNVLTTGQPQIETLTNTGTHTLSISNIRVSGPAAKDFVEVNNCGESLPARTSCQITVSFSPSASGLRTAVLTIQNNAPTNPQNVPLSGIGIGPAVVLSPLSLNFDDQTVGVPSQAQAVQVTNTGNAILNINGIGIVGNGAADFSQVNNCGSELAIGAKCSIHITFTPTVTGSRTAALQVSDNAVNSPQTVTLSGTGVLPTVTLTPNSLTFPTQIIYTTSKAQTVLLTNTGLGALDIQSISASSQFSQSNNCTSPIGPGASCTISVTFGPWTKGQIKGTVSITDNAVNSPQTIALVGVGTFVQLAPPSVDFGNQPVGTKSLAMKITFTNKGDSGLTLSGININGNDAGDFAMKTNCKSSVPAGESCFVGVTFTPLAKGPRTASVSFQDTGGASPQSVSLSGNGT